MENNEFDKEYLMLREEIIDNLKRRDQYYLIIFTLLGLTIFITNKISSIPIILLLLYLSVFLQVKINELRTTMLYIATYMEVYLESNLNISFHWETRLHKFKSSTIYKKDKLQRYMRLLLMTVFSITLYGKLLYILHVKDLSIIKKTTCLDNTFISGVILLISTIELALNIYFFIKSCTDHKTREKYKKKWLELKSLEMQD